MAYRKTDQGSIYGYARVSTKTQSLKRQLDNILAAYPNVSKVYQEKYTGTTTDRPEFRKLLKRVKSGDRIVFDSVSRMSRNAEEGFQVYQELYQKGVDCVFLKDPLIDTLNYRTAVSKSLKPVGNEIADLYIDATNKAMLLLAEQQFKQAFEAAEKEVKERAKATSEGMRAAGAGLKISAAKTGKELETLKKSSVIPQIRKLSRDFDGSMQDKEILDLLPVSRNTYYKYKKLMRKMEDKEPVKLQNA